MARPIELDRSFSRDGTVLTAINSGVCNCDKGDGVTELLSLGHGRVLAAGTSRGDLALARYDDKGGLDRSFAGDGKTSLHVEAPDDQKLAAVGLVRQRDGKIIVAAEDYFLARFNRDGSLDSSFGGDGIRYLFFKYGISDIAIQRNGSRRDSDTCMAALLGALGFALNPLRHATLGAAEVAHPP